ncbi:hypothetical protein GUJ93_ZPchr0001g33174 [Zizania palustris]|uniref:Uncharacterized protein n=1 Tax=Zizania palustris TaxID=103762 RepID=A0A8J5RXM4_ZIZPA|nr:hypothetical protein GUJ93_ZPchr0001g33174 [Zizania palustris]
MILLWIKRPSIEHLSAHRSSIFPGSRWSLLRWYVSSASHRSFCRRYISASASASASAKPRGIYDNMERSLDSGTSTAAPIATAVRRRMPGKDPRPPRVSRSRSRPRDVPHHQVYSWARKDVPAMTTPPCPRRST